MRVALDISALDPEFKAHAQRGIGRYVRELSSAMRSIQDPKLIFSEFDHQKLNAKTFSDRAIAKLPCFRQTVRQQLLYPLRLSGLNTDLIHFPAHLDAPAWSSVPIAVTVLDLIPLIFKDLYQSSKTNLRFSFGRWLENRAVKNARLVFAISECTARDVHSLLDIPRDNIVVTHLGVNERYLKIKQARGKPYSQFGLSSSDKIILYVGGIDQRKNLKTLLLSFRELLDSRPSYIPKLFLVGKIDRDDQYPALLQEIERLNLRQHITETGYLAESELHELYAAAHVFVFPSLYEGFGFPVLEAMAAGVPVIAANTSSIPEVLGESGVLVDPGDVRGFTEAMSGLLQNAERAQALSELGHERAKLFDWETTARRTLEGYQKIGYQFSERIPG